MHSLSSTGTTVSAAPTQQKTLAANALKVKHGKTLIRGDGDERDTDGSHTTRCGNVPRKTACLACRPCRPLPVASRLGTDRAGGRTPSTGRAARVRFWSGKS